MISEADEIRLRRDALQIALQLPSDPEEALCVLALAGDLVRGFLSERECEGPPPPPPLRVV